jgi:hydrogenase expression/formation protein HypE
MFQSEVAAVAEVKEFRLQCPTAWGDLDHVQLAHGGGGRRMHELLEGLLLPSLGNDILRERHDGATLQIAGARLAFTTDSYVVRPLFFPGGDIGSLAVYGTVNDLAMCGARPLYLSSALILEEGLAMETLRRVVESMRSCAAAVGVQFVTGDTKVVDKGKGDGIFVNTAGIGIVEHRVSISPKKVRPGDAILLSGDIGRHGIAIMATREGLSFESAIESDCAPLWESVAALLAAGIEIHCLRDLTRGGLSSGLIEIAEGSGTRGVIEEASLSVREEVAGACEILGLDPLYLANEGRFVAFVPDHEAERALAALRGVAVSREAVRIGQVIDGPAGMVTMKTRLGTERVIDMLSGEQLPRIC